MQEIRYAMVDGEKVPVLISDENEALQAAKASPPRRASLLNCHALISIIHIQVCLCQILSVKQFRCHLMEQIRERFRRPGPVFSCRPDQCKVQENPLFSDPQIPESIPHDPAGPVGKGQRNTFPRNSCRKRRRKVCIESERFHTCFPQRIACRPAKYRVRRT